MENQESPGLNVSSQKLSLEDEITAGGEKKWPGWPGDNVFRLIVPAQKVGAIIGRRGELVKRMCEETKSRIKILDGIPGTSERVVMVSAREEPDAAISPAMDGLLKVHRRTIDGIEGEVHVNALQTPSGAVSSKLLVAATQAGSLIGRQGATIKSIQDMSGAVVRIMPAEDLPLYGLQDDRVVEIHGEPLKVHKAMELVVSHLRKFLVDRSILPLFEFNRAMQSQSQQQTLSHSSWGPSAASGLSGTGTPGLGGTSHYSGSGLQHDTFYQTPDILDTQNRHHGVSMYGRDPGIVSTAKALPAPVITQVTQHMQIPLSYADAIIGAAGANISYMRRTSGATITIQETKGYPGEMTVELHGTSNQVQTAQQLIQNFMAGGSVPSSSTYGTTPSGSTYNAVASGPSYNSVDASYAPYTPHASLYSSTTGNANHPTGTFSSYSNTYSY